MSEEQKTISKYEVISKDIDNHFFQSPQDFSSQESSFKSYKSFHILIDMVNSSLVSEDDRSLLIKRIELYKGITRPLFVL